MIIIYAQLNLMRLAKILTGLKLRQNQTFIKNRVHLQKRQKQNIQKCASLPTDDSLLDAPLTQLQKKPSKQRFGAFASRVALPFNQQLKFLADINIDQALSLNSSGIPYTTKDQIQTEDLVTTCGYSQRICPSSNSAEIVEILAKHNCVPFAHTNVPQGLLNIEVNNHVWGHSVNPYKRGFISGGSSGGCAAAVATRCTPFSICSDTAGSARIPASFCGVVGFKPTGSKRLSVKGRLGMTMQQSPPIYGLDTSLGFITRNVDDLQWVSQRTIGKTLKPTPYMYGQWDKQKYEEAKTKKLKFGYMIEDHEMKCAPAIRNSIIESCQKLAKEGHEIVQFDFPELHEFRNFAFKILQNTYALKSIVFMLGSEDGLQQTGWTHERARFGKIGNIFRQILAGTNKLQRNLYEPFKIGNSTLDLLKATQFIEEVKEKFLDKWNQSQLDVLMTPVVPFTALRSNTDNILVNQLQFCCFQNVLELPSGSVPTRMVKREEAKYEDYSFFGAKAANSIKSSQGLPIGVQLTTQHLQDQLCVGAMWQLQKLWEPLKRPQPWC